MNNYKALDPSRGYMNQKYHVGKVDNDTWIANYYQLIIANIDLPYKNALMHIVKYINLLLCLYAYRYSCMLASQSPCTKWIFGHR